MCKLIIAKKENNDNLTEFKNFLQLNYDGLYNEKDGISAMIINYKNKISLHRKFELESYEDILSEVDNKLNDAKFIILHSRTGTSGIKDIRNVHLWKIGDWIFAHNGFVGEYNDSKSFFAGYTRHPITPLDSRINNLERIIENCKDCFYSNKICSKHIKIHNLIQELKADEKENKKNDMCDSFQFLKNIKKPLTKYLIEKEMEKTSFSGAGIFFNEKTFEYFVLVDKRCYLMSDEKTFSIFTSFEPQTLGTIKKYRNIFGIDILEKENIKLQTEKKEVIYGVYELNLKK
jgi:hypothetical protein